LDLLKRILGFLVEMEPPQWQSDRQFSDSSGYGRWLEIGIARIRDMDDVEELRLLLGHQNGYLREAALRRVDSLRTTALWTEVFGLCNDWVAPIRAKAKRVSLDWLRNADIKTLFSALAGARRIGFKAAGRPRWVRCAIRVPADGGPESGGAV